MLRGVIIIFLSESAMDEPDKRQTKDKELIKQAYVYLLDKTYPAGCSNKGSECLEGRLRSLYSRMENSSSTSLRKDRLANL